VCNVQRNFALAAYMRKLTGERQYICAHCSKGFYHRIGLAKRTLHFHSEAPLDTEVVRVDPLQKKNISVDAVDTKLMPASNTNVSDSPLLKVDVTYDNHFRSHLTQNQRTDTVITSYRCEECGKIFYEKRSIQGYICDQRFSTIRDMLEHRVIHSDDKPFECALCGMVFRLKYYLLNHMFKNHDVEKTK
jgi:KRAB domain-containing zinc finger protein